MARTPEQIAQQWESLGRMDSMPDDTDAKEIKHFLCILSTVMDCMEGSQIFCCSDCVAEQIKDWADDWLQVTNEMAEEGE